MAPRWGGLRIEPYKSEPIDADMDKIVQEGTAWERPGGTRILNQFGKEILNGATATTRSRDIKIVDKTNNAVEYTPSYGEQGFEEAPSVVTDPAGTPKPQGQSGLQTIQTVTPAQQAELRKAREARERAAALGIPPVPEIPTLGPEEWGSPAALRAEYRRVQGLDAPLTPEGESLGEIVLSEEQKEDAVDEALSAVVKRLLDPVDEAGDYTSVTLTEPKEDESELITAARELINSPKVVALKKTLQRFVKFSKPRSGYENSKAQGPVADYRRKIANAETFFRDVHAMLQNMGATSKEKAIEMIRDGFEVDGRQVVFVGEHFPEDPRSDLAAELLGSQKPEDYNAKTIDSLRSGFYVLDENGVPLMPVDVEDIPAEMMEALLKDPEAPIPLELLVHAVREATEDTGGEALRTASELEKSVSRVGQLAGEEVRTRRAKSLRESSRPTDFLSELLGRSEEELVKNASNDAARYLLHARSVGLDIDGIENLHVTEPVTAARLNAVGAAVAERILGYIPEWARRDRPDRPHDPGVGYADEAEGGAWDASGEEGGWPVHQGMWNGDPLVLLDGLVDSLSEDLATGRITGEQFLETLNNLSTLVGEALRDEIDGLGRRAARERGIEDILHPNFFEQFTGRQIADAHNAFMETIGRDEGPIGAFVHLLRSLGASTDVAEGWADDPQANDKETALKMLSHFNAEVRLRDLFGQFPASESLAGQLPEERGILPGDMVDARVTLPYLSHARGESILEYAWQLAIKDALGHRRLRDLVEDGMLPSAGSVRDEGLILRDIVREVRQYPVSTDEIRELMKGPGRTRSAGGFLPGAIDDKDVTESEREGIFDHTPLEIRALFSGRIERYWEQVNPILALISKRRSSKTKSLKEQAAITAELEYQRSLLEAAEESVMRVLENYPLDWLRKFGAAGALSIRTHRQRKHDDPAPEAEEIVPYVPVDRSSYAPYVQRQTMWQPWSTGTLSLSPESGDATTLHELTHRLDMVHPLFRPLMWAHLANRYGLDPESPPSSVNKFIKEIQLMDARHRGGVTAYSDEEVGIDLFDAGYMGRMYPDGSDHRFVDDPKSVGVPHENGVEMAPAEILTVAIEALSLPAEQRPFFLYEEGVDTKTINFILGLLLTV